MKPMLASNDHIVEADLRFPLIASPKLDGIRGLVGDGVLLSRSLKLIPNLFIQGTLGRAELNGFDGELIVGPPNVPTTYKSSVSGCMAHDGEPDFTYYVFDLHNAGNVDYMSRYHALEARAKKLPADLLPFIHVLNQVIVHNLDELQQFEASVVAGGYEGVILRDPQSAYKFGRSTLKEGIMLKLKRFEDSEAEILSCIEQQHNANEAKTNELGRTKRSSAKAGMVPMDTLGALHVRDVKSGVEFDIGGGPGLTAAMRKELWGGRNTLAGKIVKYKFFPVGVKIAPRHPQLLGFRDARDM